MNAIPLEARPVLESVGKLFQGHVSALTGEASGASHRITSGIAAYRSTGATLCLTVWLSYLVRGPAGVTSPVPRGTLHAVALRSPHAHALLRFDAAKARARRDILGGTKDRKIWTIKENSLPTCRSSRKYP
jgi:hypothetical protein